MQETHTKSKITRDRLPGLKRLVEGRNDEKQWMERISNRFLSYGVVVIWTYYHLYAGNGFLIILYIVHRNVLFIFVKLYNFCSIIQNGLGMNYLILLTFI